MQKHAGLGSCETELVIVSDPSRSLPEMRADPSETTLGPGVGVRTQPDSEQSSVSHHAGVSLHLPQF